jgi:hypothetical protein
MSQIKSKLADIVLAEEDKMGQIDNTYYRIVLFGCATLAVLVVLAIM